MFNNLFKNSIICVLFFSFSASLFSCKENTILPPDLVPAVDNINTFLVDTFTIHTENIIQDSTLTGGILNGSRISNNNAFYHALGCICNDPTFGKTYASIHVEVLPPIENFTLKTGTNHVIDSVVLVLPYKGSYGDTISAPSQTFNVYRSIQSFSRDSSQFDFTKDVFDATRLLASQTVNFNTFRKDSPLVGGIKLAPQARFKLASWFADSLKKQIDLASLGATSSFANYLAWWKGFHIEADSTVGNTLGYFDTYNTRMYIYYRYTNSAGNADTVADVFAFDPNRCNRFNTILHNYNSSSANDYLTNAPANADSVLFVQASPGLAAQLAVPYLTNFPNAVINKAEFSLYAVSPFVNWTDTNIFAMPSRLQILVSDTLGNDRFSEEYADPFGIGFADGKRYQKTLAGITYYEYRFTLTPTIQKIISQKNTNFRFKITARNTGYPASSRSMLNGSASNQLLLRPKLTIIYTKLK